MRAAIARAAQATGIDFDYLLAQAKLESSLDPNARASTSSASGLYQFTKGTWLETLDRHGSNHGLGWADAAIENGALRDPQMRAAVMALRNDPDAASLMAAELARDNKAALTGVLGREPDAAELYLAHFLGSGGASSFLRTLMADPGRSAASILPKAAAANRSIFYEPSGAARSVSGVMDLMRGKVARAMEGGDGSAWAVQGAGNGFGQAWAVMNDGSPSPGSSLPPQPAHIGGAVAREFHAARLEAPAASRPSMADTLQTTFGDLRSDGASAAPEFVRNAYSRMQRFGL
ncbi:MAG: lytic transglycosylase domain-containing protein [Novosphingobium sp.]|nr:lytic transglycosylase domain-containing protein [Novosphingobium sp.]